MRLEIFTDKTIIVDTNIIWNAASGGVENHSELNLDDGTNPHGTTKTDVGLSNVDNTADIEKNVLTAQKLIFKVKATEDILKGQAVTYSGYNQGEDAIEVTLADETIANGLATENINNGSFGYIIQSGQLTDVDTSNWSNGTMLFTATNGNLTDVEPTEYDAQPIAFVLRSNQNNGALQVNADYPKQDAYDVRYDANNSVGDKIDSIVYSEQFSLGQIATTNGTDWHSAGKNYSFNIYNIKSLWANADISPNKEMPSLWSPPFKCKIKSITIGGYGYTASTYTFKCTKYNRVDLTNQAVVMPDFTESWATGDVFSFKKEIGSGLNEVILEDGESLFFIWKCTGANRYIWDTKTAITYEKID